VRLLEGAPVVLRTMPGAEQAQRAGQ